MGVMPKEVKVLNQKIDALEKKQEISKTLLEDKCQSVMQGEDNLQDVELDMWKVNFNVVSKVRELADLQQEMQAIHPQLGEMQQGGRLFFGLSQFYIHLPQLLMMI
jgi:predicted  nucleic acid-binding Zn-ribbon protein